MKGEWIDVRERQAEERDTVLVIDKDGDCYVAVSCRGEYCPRTPWSGAYRDVTHWMPLPAPPVDWYKEMEKNVGGLDGFTQALEQRIARLERDVAILKPAIGAK